ncbi:MAG: helix-turn-helix transcriptional regulator [Alphaproteobacteria bacterium]|nr:helix-turn-helix transcriptional regulator [Alphaproteobacteria bacterium]
MIEVAESSDMTLSVYHRIEMGQREVSDKEMKNIAKALKMSVDELKKQIKTLDENGLLEEIIQRNDARYKLLSTPRGMVSPYNSTADDSQISVFGVAGKDGNIIIDIDDEIKKLPCPLCLQNKKEVYAVNLCTRRLGNLLPSRAVLFVDPQEPVSIGDIALYYLSETEVKILSIREDEKGQLYGIRWNPDEKTFLTNDDLQKLHRVVLISL